MEQEKTKKRTLSEQERKRRFKQMAVEVDASESAESFDHAFAAVVTLPQPRA